jgi:galacturonosyltransferase
MSSVCDAGNLVRNGYNGFLFDPTSSKSLAKAIQKFQELSSQQRSEMGRRSRQIAEKWLDMNIIVEKYLEVLTDASNRSRCALKNWPSEVPETAVSFLRSISI